jgi:hypothetical protein
MAIWRVFGGRCPPGECAPFVELDLTPYPITRSLGVNVLLTLVYRQGVALNICLD